MTRKLLLLSVARNAVALVVLVPLVYFQFWLPLAGVESFGAMLSLMGRTLLLIALVAGLSSLLWAPVAVRVTGVSAGGLWRRTAPSPARPATVTDVDPFRVDAEGK